MFPSRRHEGGRPEHLFAGRRTADAAVVSVVFYEQSVQALPPYDAVQAPNQSARDAMVQIADRSLRGKRSAFLLVNNRLEGNAPATIEQDHCGFF
jgi:hypothetical protein